VNPVCLDGSCVQCTPNTTQCSTATQPQACSAGGLWQNKPVCAGATPACLTGTCEECVPDDTRCSGNDSQVCNASKKWEKVQTCSIVCGGKGVCGVCQPNDYRCNANTDETCNASGQWYSKATPQCTLACTEAGRYTVNDKENTTTDLSTNLKWQRNAKYTAITGYINYTNAVAYCANLVQGPGTWRLPTNAEMTALTPLGCNAFDEAAFPGIAGQGQIGFWTSTPSNPGTHQVAMFGADFDNKLHNVMCVHN
jgi:hypothetical protein